MSKEQPAYQFLESRGSGHTKELATLLEVSRNVASTLELEPLLGLILDQLKNVVDYSSATILGLEGDDLAVLACRDLTGQDEARQLCYRMEEALSHREVLLAQKPCIIPEVRGVTPLAGAFREAAGERPGCAFGRVRSWMGVPLIARDRTIGMLSLYHGEPDHYSPREAKLALVFANQAATAIENARRYQVEQERRREAEQRRRVAEGLRDILTTINSNSSLTEILDHVVMAAGMLLGADTVVLYRRQARGEPPTIQASRGLPVDTAVTLDLPLGPGIAGSAPPGRRPMVIPDIDELLTRRDSAPDARPHRPGACRALLAVPILIKRDVYGGIELYYPEPREFSDEEVRLAASLADQAALAIENARLRARAEEAAVTAERTRLARDLHDSVTQTLFSASLIAEVLPRLWERSPEEGRCRLEELRQLTRGALAEMRALLLELRPAALTEVDLGDLLRQLAEATTGRARVPVAVAVEGNRTLPPDVQVALYRIAQEALNNVAKHAGAARASVELRFRPAGVELSIVDDGCGFDPGGVSAEHLGLEIMGERAEAVGAAIRIDSRIGHGTRVTVRWAVKEE